MSKSDKELLELAAKAVGIEWVGYSEEHGLLLDPFVFTPWNPLKDLGDSLYLAVTLGLNGETTLRSIVIAAAEIGESISGLGDKIQPIVE